MSTLQGKLVVITGGGNGIGEATSKMAAARGAQVILADLSKANLDKVLPKLQGKNHGAFQCNVASKQSVDDLYDNLIKFTGGRVPDAVINCAGILINLKGVAGCTEDLFDKMMDVNGKGTYLIGRKFALAMKEHGVKGSIVNVTSVATKGAPQAPGYAASKGAAQSFTISLAKEMAPYGIRVNGVAPAPTNTDLFKGIGAGGEKVLDNIRSGGGVPLGGPAEPEQIGEVLLFLASPASSFVTGSIYEADGGAKDSSLKKDAAE